MLTLAFPPGKTDWIIWFSIIPLLKSIENENMSNIFKLGVISGLAHYLTLLYWIIIVLNTYGGLSIILSILILILLCLYLSVFTGIFSIIASRFYKSGYLIIAIPVVWVALEYIRSVLFTGFPWCLLGYSQYRHLPLIQISDISGVYGISFLIVCVNVTVFMLFQKTPVFNRYKSLIAASFFIMVLIIGTLIYGNFRLREYDSLPKEGKNINVSVVQGNIDQSVKWDEAFQQQTMEKYISLTIQSFDSRPSIIVWPETAIPFFFDKNRPESKPLFEIPAESGAHFIFGCPAYKTGDKGTEYYNRAICLSPDGDIAGQYDKTHLVPFGEYVPLKRFLPFVQRLVTSAGDFSSGDSVAPIRLPGINAGVLICYEIIFPDISRKHVRKGADVLINITNDAWFGISSAPFQHLYMSIFRAVENHRPLIRSANTGFSAFINPRGRIEKHGDLFTEEVLTCRINADDDSITFYSRFGDIFAHSMLLLCLIKIIHELFSKLLYNKFFHKEVGNGNRATGKNRKHF